MLPKASKAIKQETKPNYLGAFSNITLSFALGTSIAILGLLVAIMQVFIAGGQIQWVYVIVLIGFTLITNAYIYNNYALPTLNVLDDQIRL